MHPVHADPLCPQWLGGWSLGTIRVGSDALPWSLHWRNIGRYFSTGGGAKRQPPSLEQWPPKHRTALSHKRHKDSISNTFSKALIWKQQQWQIFSTKAFFIQANGLCRRMVWLQNKIKNSKQNSFGIKMYTTLKSEGLKAVGVFKASS